MITFALGTLDAATGLRPEKHIFVADKGDHSDIADGVAGRSLAWHLTKPGWSGVVLPEREQLTSGTVGRHASALIPRALGPIAQSNRRQHPRKRRHVQRPTGNRHRSRLGGA